MGRILRMCKVFTALFASIERCIHRTGTVFHGTKLPLTVRFLAIYLVSDPGATAGPYARATARHAAPTPPLTQAGWDVLASPLFTGAGVGLALSTIVSTRQQPNAGSRGPGLPGSDPVRQLLMLKRA